MPFIDFLSADTALVKTFTLSNGQIEKSPYPMVRDFTSHREEFTGIESFFNVLTRAAAQGWCMSKGTLTRQIKEESRAGLTEVTEQTNILLLDLDGLTGHRDIHSVLMAAGLAEYSHVIQWSASAWLKNPAIPTSTTTPFLSSEKKNQTPTGGPETSLSKASASPTTYTSLPATDRSTPTVPPTTSSFTPQPGVGVPLSAHVFFVIRHPVTPSLIKSWIMRLNMTTFGTNIRLTRTGAALHWPIDPSVADNSKLIYIAPPKLRGGLQPPSPAPDITFVKGRTDELPSTLFTVNPQEVTQERTKLLNELRKKAGLSIIRDSQFKVHNGQLYMSKPGEATITGIKHERGFVYLNLNGGDSWGYYHPEDNSEYIYNFKGEPIYKTSELLSEYFTSLTKKAVQKHDGPAQYFVCRDFYTDRLYNGVYYVNEDRLDMARAANEGRLKSFLKQHGQPVQDFIPDFSITYDPHNKVKFSLEDRFINTYVPSAFEALPRREQEAVPSMIERVIKSAVGEGEPYEHFLNWLANIVQFKEKIGTAWVLHGNEGTGKGVLFHRVITPILGKENVASITMRALDSPFNGFMERALAVFVDEVQIPALKGSLGISATLRNFITEKTISVRRMYTEPYNAPNYTNFIFASNMPDPVIVPPTDRRFHVGAFQSEKLVLSDAELHIIDAQVEDFYMYLAARTVNRSNSRKILESEDRERLMRLSMTAADTMAETLLTGDVEDLVVNLPQHATLPNEAAYTALVKSILAKGEQESQLTRDEIFTIFHYRVGKEVPDSPNKFTSFLKHHRIYTKRIKSGNRTFYGISVTWNKDKEWMQESLAQLAPQQALAAQENVVPIKKAKLAT
jgi:Predicted ATPase